MQTLKRSISKSLPTSLFAALLCAALPATSAFADDCEFFAERNAVVDLKGADVVEIDASAGSLEVIGEKGATQVNVEGEACSSDAELLKKVALRTRRAGSSVLIEAETPEGGGWGWGGSETSRLDLRIAVPAGIRVKIDDGSGSMEVRGVGRLSIDDGSGSIEVADIDGEVSIEDGSGEMILSDIRGDVRIDDGSGSIEIRGVVGSLQIDDGSGEVQVERVTENVRVRDGSGSIDVREIGGDFIVADDGSGSVKHRDVMGRVDVPVDD